MDELLEILVRLIVSMIENAAKRRAERQKPAPAPRPQAAPRPRPRAPAVRPQPVRARAPAPPAPAAARAKAARPPAAPRRALVTADAIRDAVILDAILARR